VNWPALALVPLLWGTQACTVILSPGEAQCETDADCAARGFDGAACVDAVCVGGDGVGGADTVWGCLGNVVEPVADTSKSVELSVRLAFASDSSPLTSGTVDFCDKLDINCTGDSANFPKGLSPNADGVVTVSVKQGFDGFVRITDPEIVDSRVYVGRPIVEVPKVKEIQLLRPNEYAALAGIAQGMVDETRGTAILLAIDCKGDSASGVRFESPNADDDSIAFYLINQAPTIPPTATETDVDGFGGFFNLPVSAAVARSFRAVDDAFVGESSFQVVANTISYVQIAPTPQ
jgi:hypothetical protein